tara:strand:+ start:1028 stop:1978 length:951 start_codon:yes stop_codon:yes gene_type:complete
LKKISLLLLLPFFAPFIYLDYSKSFETLTFIDEMVSKHKFEKSSLLEIFKSAKKREKIIKSMNRPAEKKFSWVQYKSRLISSARINNGVIFLEKFLPEFKKAEKKFGVPKEIIAAIIGIESSYGSITGRERVIDSLSTLAFDYPRRSKFFTKQLEHFLLLTREEKLDPLIMKGSYAGAMGYGQFIPSSYRSYAIDFDGDGLRNIVTNPIDAIGSVANYLSKHGWERNAIIAQSLEKKDVNSNFKTSLSLKELDTLELVSKSNLSDKKYLQINFENKEFWLGHKNLYVLSRYNRSSFYVMAVYLLSKEIDYAYRVKT